MLYTVHHTHKHGVTITILPKALVNGLEFLAKHGHDACKELHVYSKDKFTHIWFDIEHSVEGED